jgi:hypothetical protein
MKRTRSMNNLDNALAVIGALNALVASVEKAGYDAGFEAGFNEANARSDEDGEQGWTRGYLDGVDDARRDPKLADEMVGVIVRWQVAEAAEQMDDADLREPEGNAHVEGEQWITDDELHAAVAAMEGK